jgi:hypothetical protein
MMGSKTCKYCKMEHVVLNKLLTSGIDVLIKKIKENEGKDKFILEVGVAKDIIKNLDYLRKFITDFTCNGG